MLRGRGHPSAVLAVRNPPRVGSYRTAPGPVLAFRPQVQRGQSACQSAGQQSAGPRGGNHPHDTSEQASAKAASGCAQTPIAAAWLVRSGVAGCFLEALGEVLDERIIQAAVDLALARLRTNHGGHLARRDQIERELSQIEARERRLVDAIKRSGEALDPLVNELRAEEARKHAPGCRPWIPTASKRT